MTTIKGTTPIVPLSPVRSGAFAMLPLAPSYSSSYVSKLEQAVVPSSKNRRDARGHGAQRRGFVDTVQQ
jgi:hypothetical protein